jgi:hypothetical protein
MAAIGGDWYASRCTHGNKPCPQSDDTVRFVYSTQPDGAKYIVAKVWSGDDGDYESTARLVAAAPELLAALKDAYDALDYAQAQVDSDSDRMHLTRCRRRIMPVIAKAEGRE